MSNADSLGDRMKKYEQCSRYSLLPNTPVVCRVDGKAFHTFTKGFAKPFDECFIKSMVESAKAVAKEIQSFKIAYIQSDEASFVFNDYDKINSDGWFDYNINKIVSITASLMSVKFNKHIRSFKPELDRDALFDSRVFNLPENEIANCLLWRAKDWQRNSLQMYCRSIISHKKLQNKKSDEMHELLFENGKNWTTDLKPYLKNGVFLLKDEREILELSGVQPHYEDIEKIVKQAFNK